MVKKLPIATSHPTPALKRRKQLEQDLEHITQEMYRRNRELATTNQTLSLLRAIDSIVLESPESLKVVCEQIAETITNLTDYPFAALLTRSGTTTHEEFELFGWSVKGQKLPDTLFGKPVPMLKIDTKEWIGVETHSKVIPVHEFSTKDIAHFLGCSEATVHELQHRLPVKSLYVAKLFARQRVVGILVAGFFVAADTITPQDTQLLDRLSESAGVALDNRLLSEENRRVLVRLRHSNVKLKALDETKDDFISMASHQLRTPLTSVKGYLSLVLEGDAGTIKDDQRKLLAQAYDSSQRMVYLISDLLNVSRLRTGKFIIDAAPVNLADVITDEVSQLKETAAIRSVELVYTKPAEFPTLMLDETKIRQVIMNFMDNAIYYTPTGGKIQIELTNKTGVVELRVIDNGIGVPRSEQHHLFTKFYRAGNARKMRPDGTGLGLFMAKKVITAQGGAIVFDSTEGKGSTFGFTFSKSKLEPLPPKP